MSLYGSMRTAVSGMNGQANMLSTVADNIANSSTTGYKKASVQFSSMVLPSTSGTYNSGSIETKVAYGISQQGSLSYTSSDTDLAINGDGFFIVNNGDGSNYLTRAGSFTIQDDGTLQNASGYTLMGYEYSSTEDPTIVVNGYDGLSPIDLSGLGISATASTTGSLVSNLPSTEPDGFSQSTSLVAYDSQGNSRLLTFTYTKTADNEWSVEASYDDEGTPVQVLAPTTLTFDVDGTLISPDPAELVTDSIDSTVLDGAELPQLTIDLGNTTQLASDFAVTTGEVDGNAASAVSGYDIDSDGIVSVIYENGDVVPTYRIAMANVQSPNNLTVESGNLYSQSSTSGVVVLGYAGSSGFGEIISGALEDSTVDTATELTNMIAAQRNYTANSKVFQTGSELLDTLVNLKR
ncbi:flagellar hook protein FlgE [Rhizobium halophytocola]|uniref:Flagellar hook protein FlgE n=1 Tax=Rhizobium halophytocola TaxID=735519 RepID=A0ABS4E5C0_9HYPH|nr:flagellar hook protein FlgE [Rhizobium halophytocola]MBP1853135.1 flagellar hook protein FlgE [Rhizobium halophytocola]